MVTGRVATSAPVSAPARSAITEAPTTMAAVASSFIARGSQGSKAADMHDRRCRRPGIGSDLERIARQKWPSRFDLPHSRPRRYAGSRHNRRLIWIKARKSQCFNDSARSGGRRNTDSICARSTNSGSLSPRLRAVAHGRNNGLILITNRATDVRSHPTTSAPPAQRKPPAMTISVRDRRAVLIRRFGPVEAFGSRRPV